MKNIYGDCRKQCADADDLYQCIEDCRDQPLVDMVAKEFGPAEGEKCRGFNKRLDAAVWRLDPNFVAQAERKSKLVARSARKHALQYWKMPVAPYPPQPNVAPRGVVNSIPDYKALLAFMKSEPCYKYQLIAKAKQQLGAPPAEEKPDVNVSSTPGGWKFWAGAAGLAFALWHFSGR